MENRLPKFGLSVGSYGPQPSDHSRVCWASAIGAAARGRSQDDGELIGRRAAAMLADGTAGCICSTRKRRKR